MPNRTPPCAVGPSRTALSGRPWELAKIIKSDKEPHKDYLVIDVRDDDHIGGHILGSYHLSSVRFQDSVQGLVQKTKDIPIVIFHCALSQARGPKAARIYSETRDNLQIAGKDQPHDVCILRGGFTEFQAKFRNDPKLVEAFDASIQEAGYTQCFLYFTTHEDDILAEPRSSIFNAYTDTG
ncbi:hypothetical protein PENSPDRAFT_760477 [Peniophora sp. CONT]|nr:hypothetical protein PENSPDRAFT_760477 [Peniophora sp. CONT]